MMDKLFAWIGEKESRRKCWYVLFLVLAFYGAVKLLGGLWVNLVYLGVQVWDHFSPQTMAVSIGVIGGADGPTAIFVTAPLWLHYLFPALMLITGICGLLKLKRNREK